MTGKFAVLNYSDDRRQIKKADISRLFKKRIRYEAKDCTVLGTKGFIVTLPVTKDEADVKLTDKLYRDILGNLAETGVNAIVAAKGSVYEYDEIIPALSGFYVLPFLLPLLLKKCTKILNNDNPELLIIDDMEDLTIDILCIVSQEVNRITVLTKNSEIFEEVAEQFYSDSGLNINVTDKEMSAETSDIILNTSYKPDKLLNKYKKGSIYFDMVGDKNKTLDVLKRRQDMTVADGMELKVFGEYIDNVLLEAVLYSNNECFRAYLNGKYNNYDFYSVLEKIEAYNLKITMLKRFGINI